MELSVLSNVWVSRTVSGHKWHSGVAKGRCRCGAAGTVSSTLVARFTIDTSTFCRRCLAAEVKIGRLGHLL